MGSWDTLCDSGLHGSQRLAADLRVKWKRAANPTTLTFWESMPTYGLLLYGKRHWKSSHFQKAQKNNFFRAFPNTEWEGTLDYLRTMSPVSRTLHSFCFNAKFTQRVLIFCDGRGPKEKLILTFRTYRTKSSVLWKGDHGKLQSLA